MNRLDRAYAMVPVGNCKGLCQQSCGVVPPSPREAERILERRGVNVDYDPETLTCKLLVDGRCSIYADRPLLCRLWGNVKKMPCTFGCDNPPIAASTEKKVMKLVYE